MTTLFSPRRPLGRTGFVATRIGQGDVADRQLPIERCVAVLRRALDAGINLLDTAPGYEDGFSEEIVGAALAAHGQRDTLFVVDKIDHLEQPVAPQLDDSLRRLRQEHVDLVALHNLSSVDGWRAASGEGGAMHQLGEAIRAGKARFRGISSHHPEVLRLAIPSGLCDVVMFPIGPFVDRRYVDEILPLARQHGVGTICFKTFGAGKLVADTPGYNQPLQARPRGKLSSGGESGSGPQLPHLGAAECVRYTLTVDPDVALLGLSFPNEQDVAWAAAQSFTPLSEAELRDLERRAKEAVQKKGPCWWNPPAEAR
jgi:aryl-alcohol dehydrogenase-like predicted oxidoreductase